MLFHPPGDRPDPGIKPEPVKSPALASRFFTTSTTWETLRFLLCTLSKINLTITPTFYPFYLSNHQPRQFYHLHLLSEISSSYLHYLCLFHVAFATVSTHIFHTFSSDTSSQPLSTTLNHINLVMLNTFNDSYNNGHTRTFNFLDINR